MLLSVSFEPIFVDFAFVFNVLALSPALIFAWSCVCGLFLFSFFPATIFFQKVPIKSVNSYGAIVFFRERSPAIFCASQNITKHAVSVILALYFQRSRPESNPAVVLLS